MFGAEITRNSILQGEKINKTVDDQANPACFQRLVQVTAVRRESRKVMTGVIFLAICPGSAETTPHRMTIDIRTDTGPVCLAHQIRFVVSTERRSKPD